MMMKLIKIFECQGNGDCIDRNSLLAFFNSSKFWCSSSLEIFDNIPPLSFFKLQNKGDNRKAPISIPTPYFVFLTNQNCTLVTFDCFWPSYVLLSFCSVYLSFCSVFAQFLLSFWSVFALFLLSFCSVSAQFLLSLSQFLLSFCSVSAQFLLSFFSVSAQFLLSFCSVTA